MRCGIVNLHAGLVGRRNQVPDAKSEDVVVYGDRVESTVSDTSISITAMSEISHGHGDPRS